MNRLIWTILVFLASRLNDAITATTTLSDDRSIQRGREMEEESAYRKCYQTLDFVTAGADTLSQSQYVTFLSQLDGGAAVPTSQFGDLDAVYILIFYMTACEDASICAPGTAPPSIRIGNTSDPSENLRLLCRTVLRESNTTVDAKFQYSIQYSASQIDYSRLENCLSTATVNAILNVLGCEFLSTTNSTKRRSRRLRSEHGRFLASRDFLEILEDFWKRRDLQVGNIVASADDTCPYTVSSSVDDIEDVDCGADENGAIECGLVRAMATVVTTQFVEPFAPVLRAIIIGALEETINNGQFLQFFPQGVGCFKNESNN